MKRLVALVALGGVASVVLRRLQSTRAEQALWSEATDPVD